MEYTLDKLDEAVLYYLTTLPDKPLSMRQIYNGICEDNICPELSNPRNRELNKIKFTTICHTMDSKFKNIHKYPYNNNLYLMCSTKTKSDIISDFNKAYNQTPTPTPNDGLELINYCDMFDFALKNPKYSSQFNLTEYIDGKNTILHLICLNKRKELLNKLLDNYDVDIKSINKDNKTAIELLIENNAPASMINELIEYDNFKKNKKQLENIKRIEGDTNQLKFTVLKKNLIIFSLAALNILQFYYYLIK